MEHFIFHQLGTMWIKTIKGEVTSIEVLRRDSSYFVVLNNDTISDSLWNYELVTDIYWFDTTINKYGNLKVYDDRRLSEVIPDISATDSGFFLVNLVGAFDNRALGIGTVKAANLDDDVNDEYIVEVSGGHRDQYYFFDDSISGWKSHGQICCKARWAFGYLDNHLEGFIGLASQGWGSGFGSTTFDYYKLDRDSIRLCFSINAEYGLWVFPWMGYQQEILSTSESQIVQGKIFVTHHTRYEIRDSTTRENLIFLCVDNSQYEFVETPNGRYEPSPRSEAFDASYDSTEFDVEYAIRKKVYRIKQTGSRWQKSLLKEVAFDTTVFH